MSELVTRMTLRLEAEITFRDGRTEWLASGFTDPELYGSINDTLAALAKNAKEHASNLGWSGVVVVSIYDEKGSLLKRDNFGV